MIDDSGGFVTLDFSIPQSMLGSNNSSKIRYVVQTDGSVQYGNSNDEREGLTVDWFRVTGSNGTIVDINQLSNSSSASDYSINAGTNDWAFIQIGAGGLSISDSLEDAPHCHRVVGRYPIKQAKQVGNSVQFVQTTRMDQVHSLVQV